MYLYSVRRSASSRVRHARPAIFRLAERSAMRTKPLIPPLAGLGDLLARSCARRDASYITTPRQNRFCCCFREIAARVSGWLR